MRYTVKTEHRVAVTLVDFIRTHTGWSVRFTLNWIREQIAASDEAGWYKPAWNKETETVEWLHTDTIGEFRERSEDRERYDFYEEK
jgi:hypothetical protein